MRRMSMLFAGLVASVLIASPALATLVTFIAADGRSAEADFTVSGTTLNITLTNTTTISSSQADHLLTSLAFDLGSVSVLSGTAFISSGSTGYNFTSGTLAAGTNVGSEWGFGNNGQCCAGFGVDQFVSAMTSGATPFDSSIGDLDGHGFPTLNGPSSGLSGTSYTGPLANIQSSLDITLMLSASMTQNELDALLASSGVVFEWGSDVFPNAIPEPSAGLLYGAGLVVSALVVRRRRSQ